MTDMHSGAGQNPAQPQRHEQPAAIQAIKLRHPWRGVVAALLIIVAGLFIYDALYNRPVFSWDIVVAYCRIEGVREGDTRALKLRALHFENANLLHADQKLLDSMHKEWQDRIRAPLRRVWPHPAVLSA